MIAMKGPAQIHRKLRANCQPASRCSRVPYVLSYINDVEWGLDATFSRKARHILIRVSALRPGS